MLIVGRGGFCWRAGGLRGEPIEQSPLRFQHGDNVSDRSLKAQVPATRAMHGLEPVMK